MLINSKKILGIFAVIALGGIGYHYWHHQQYFPTTDDAYIQANVINIAPRVPGAVTSVAVQNLQHVHAGQPLFTLDPEPYQLAMKQAQAQRDNTIQQMKAAMMEVASMEALVTERQAEWIQSQQNAKRVLALVQKKLYPPSEGDDATRQLNVSIAALSAAKSQLAEAQQKLGALGENNAQVQVATAALNQAKLNLQYTQIKAPTDGQVANLSLRQGDQVTAYQPLFALVEENSWWVSANFKETQLIQIKPGQLVKLTVDMYPRRVFHGHVDSFSSGSGTSFSLLPAENATGNWVKVTQRFPIKIVIDDVDPQAPLRMGSSATVTIDTLHPPLTIDPKTLSESAHP